MSALGTRNNCDVNNDRWSITRRGFLSYPVPLQIQCLLFVIGNLFDKYGKPIPGLALLPSSIRFKLLLLLPAIDVCQLETTPVTCDILMDEIWERLYKERIPLQKFYYYKNTFNMADSPSIWMERNRLDLSWKDIYFITVFACEQYHYCSSHENVSCKCQYFLSLDLLYSIYTLDNDGSVIHQCFPNESGLKVTHNLYQYYHACQCTPRFVPGFHFKRFVAPSISAKVDYKLSVIPYWDVISAMIDHQVPLKHVTISPDHIKIITDNMGPQVSGRLVKLFSFLESIEICSCHVDSAVKLSEFLDLIFDANECQIKSAVIRDHINIVSPFFSKHKESHHLKKLEVSLDVKEFSNTPTLGTNRPCTTKASEYINKILRCQRGLEEFNCHFTDRNFHFGNIHHLGSLDSVTDLFYRPGFKVLSFDNDGFYGDTLFESILDLLGHFFLSPYPVTLHLSLKFSHYNIYQPQPEELPVHKDQKEKTLSFSNCGYFPYSSSILPKILKLKSLQIKENEWAHVQNFTCLQSIVAHRFSLSIRETTTSINIHYLKSILNTVQAKEWDLSIIMKNEGRLAKIFIELLGDVLAGGEMLLLRDHGVHWLEEEVIRLAFETIFCSMSLSRVDPYFELGLPSSSLNSKVAEIALNEWRKSGSTRLKRIRIFGELKDISSVTLLSEMAIEVTVIN
uniref:F-box domain-containing protein n=1 Tax=Amphimedon queenslandica TaxID=400682 RepID=A0A1X7URG9_AMPQE